MLTRLRSKLSRNRCPLCHEGLGDESYRCDGCETAYHSECVTEFGGCGTLGCAQMAAAVHGVFETPREFNPLRAVGGMLAIFALYGVARVVASEGWAAAGLFVLAMVYAQHFFGGDWARFWARTTGSPRQDGPDTVKSPNDP